MSRFGEGSLSGFTIAVAIRSLDLRWSEGWRSREQEIAPTEKGWCAVRTLQLLLSLMLKRWQGHIHDPPPRLGRFVLSAAQVFGGMP